MAHSSRNWTGARTPQALKRVRQSGRRNAILQPRRSAAKTEVKDALLAAASGDAEATREAVAAAASALDKAAKVGAIHPNNAARRKSRLMLRANAALGGEVLSSAVKPQRQVGRTAAAKAAKARIAAGKASKAKGEQTAAGKARAALTKSSRSESAAAAAAAPATVTADTPAPSTSKSAAKKPAAKKPAAKASATKGSASKSTAAKGAATRALRSRRPRQRADLRSHFAPPNAAASGDPDRRFFVCGSAAVGPGRCRAERLMCGTVARATRRSGR